MEPKIAAKEPKEIQLVEGKIYSWCACGHSSTQPFCDGSHTSTDKKPEIFKAEKNETVYLCMCKHTGDKPFCDGSHRQFK